MILVFAEQRDGVLKKAAKEAVSEGKRLSSKLSVPVAAVMMGKGAEQAVDEVKKFGPDKVFIAEGSSLDQYSADGFAEATANVAKEQGATVILFPATTMGVDVSPRVAAKVEAGLVSDITGLSVADGKLVAIKPVYSGKAVATVKFKSDIQMVTLRSNVFPLEENPSTPEVSKVDAAGISPKGTAVSTELKEGGKVELAEAAIVVSGGRGLKGPENFPLIEELAQLLGGAVGASRAAVDAGWIDHSHQVGQTGKVVSPTVYIACGISGAIQHIAGMGSSKFIIAINKDEDAPIFNVSSLGIVGDLFKVVPALTEELKKLG